MSLKDLEESLNRKEAELAAGKLNDAIRGASKKTRPARKKDAGLLAEKLKLANGIMDWAGQFAGTSQFKRLMELGFQTAVDGVHVYSYGLGYSARHDGINPCWARVYVLRDGKIHYTTGFKGYSSGVYVYKAPEGLASRMSHESLGKFWQAIDSGSIYETIKELHGLR